ncbi:hypothetical protein [Pseudomonas putida]|uniref:Uncharacterized protein n=1 Tax=Pseudomonas putida TaxID=303 RepID=A0A8I1JFZ5_PSEPU|nr:hypothetical protein [Pseudomonas putida]MBI6882322.1 hypothetical protein [Pseudomonas putida]
MAYPEKLNDRFEKHAGLTKTDDPVGYMFDVDKEWATEYARLSKKLKHFPFLRYLEDISPRIVKIATLRPESLIRLLNNRKQDDDFVPGPFFSESTWGKERQRSLEKWKLPALDEWDLEELHKAEQEFHNGETPIEALMYIHSNCWDGDEDPSIKIPIKKTIYILVIFIAVAAAAYLLLSA